MSDGKPKPLKYRELRKKLKEFGVIEDPHCRGKGSKRGQCLKIGGERCKQPMR
ncbi:MAG: hypothetical protein QME81_11890 [bacterium]|nr:hypothetical protein [bacterium]